MPARRKVIKGIPISPGIALGHIRVVLPGHLKVAEIPVPESRVPTEIAALEKAIAETVDEIRLLRDAARKKMGATVTKVFDAQLLIAQDVDFIARVRERIAERRINAGFVYNSLVQETTQSLLSSPDLYMRQMAQEIEGVANRVLAHLSGYRQKSTAEFDEDTIIVAKSFTPGEVLSYRQRRAAGLLAAEGGSHSHAALIARSLLVPMIVAPDITTSLTNRNQVIVDGGTGQVIVNPTKVDWSAYQKKRKSLGPAIISRIKQLTEIPPVTKDGKPFEILANLEFPGPADDILAEKKIPVGLYRTEFLYLENEPAPGEQAQYEYYFRIAEKFSNSYVVFRTFDLGADKVRADSFTPPEANPALGWRGIRPMLDLPEVFKTQIRALLRASVYKNIRILLPMISDVSEYRRARRLISQVMLEMRRSSEPFDENVPVGIMVEVPSAALTAALFAAEVDFVSIGTNDLTQYTMSADRGNNQVAGLYSPYHPSVLSLIRMTVEACRKSQVPVNVCGEVAGDPLALALFVGMGVSGLSMNPARVFDTCRLVKRIDSEVARLLVDPVMMSKSTAAVCRKLQNYRNALENR